MGYVFFSMGTLIKSDTMNDVYRLVAETNVQTEFAKLEDKHRAKTMSREDVIMGLGDLISGRTLGDLRFIYSQIEWMDSCYDMVSQLKKSGHRTVLMTQNVGAFAAMLKDEYGFDDHFGCSLVLDGKEKSHFQDLPDRCIIGGFGKPVVSSVLKGRYIHDLVTEKKAVAQEECFGVGSSGLDIYMFQACGVKLGVNYVDGLDRQVDMFWKNKECTDLRDVSKAISDYCRRNH